MLSNFTIKNNKIVLKNDGEYFGALGDFEYPIGDKLYEFAIMDNKEFEKLKAIYTQLIELVCYAKETASEEERYDCFFKMFQLVRACLEFSPYTHFYTQVLIDIIIKTYNTKTFRTDLLFKSQIGVLIEDSKYYPNEFYRDLEEDEYTPEILLIKWNEEIEYGRHYKHPKEFPKKKFKQWLKKAIELRDSYDDNKIEEFKMELKKLSSLYFKK